MLILSVSDMAAGTPSAAAPSAARPFFNRLSDASVFLTCWHLGQLVRLDDTEVRMRSLERGKAGASAGSMHDRYEPWLALLAMPHASYC